MARLSINVHPYSKIIDHPKTVKNFISTIYSSLNIPYNTIYWIIKMCAIVYFKKALSSFKQIKLK